MKDVTVAPTDMNRLHDLIGPERTDLLNAALSTAMAKRKGAAVWHVNSTANGGGVAEMLQVILAYWRGAGVDARWLVMEGEPSFFAATKRLHNFIHGMPGDGGTLGHAERISFDEVAASNVAKFIPLISPDDVVVLHDPQPAGMIPELKKLGVPIVWRCHIGRDDPNVLTGQAWEFLAPYIMLADRVVVSREAHIPPGIDPRRVHVIPPCIDPFAPKNADLSAEEVHRVLVRIGVLDAPDDDAPVTFSRLDGSTDTLPDKPKAMLIGDPLPVGAPVVVQVSRWDRLKDMVGVMQGFLYADLPSDAHVVLCGPDVVGVHDDPEGAEVFLECEQQYLLLSKEARRRVHLVSLPMHDLEANAHMVNAIQRHATIVAQKSLFEGFGLTVTEGMWKGRPMVASAVGGIQDQITDGVSGLLVQDPRDLAAFGDALRRLLSDPTFARKLGEAGRERAHSHYLGDRSIRQWMELVSGV
ncbi:MAG: glycosyltransferase [Dermatophilaceae bacterium]